MSKKIIYLEAQIKGNHDHISNIEKDLFTSFWDLMETVNHHFGIEKNEYINIIDKMIDFGNVVVGDYYITLDNKDANNLELLNEARNEMFIFLIK